MQYLFTSLSVCLSASLARNDTSRLSALKTSQIFSRQKGKQTTTKTYSFWSGKRATNNHKSERKNSQLFVLEFITNGYKRFALEWLTRVGTFNNNKIKRKEKKKRNKRRWREKGDCVTTAFIFHSITCEACLTRLILLKLILFIGYTRRLD